ncbi:MAG: hypothetical protein OSA42_03690 [Porticoccaceae bacterium]|nr:hypothetical protein [Porticoccaceae bacterium]
MVMVTVRLWRNFVFGARAVILGAALQGCSLEQGTTVKKYFLHGGLERVYWLHIPKKIRLDAPLVLVFHGYTGSATGVMRYTQINEIANREGFIVAYPQGTVDAQGHTFFNVGYDFNADSSVDDVDYARQLILQLHQDYSLSASNTFATGFSNGGDMSYLLACTASDLIRAVAPVSGVLMKTTKDMCLRDNPIPLFAIHGTDDNISLYAGDMDNLDGYGAYLDIPDTAQFFVSAHGLNDRQTSRLEDLNPNDGSSILFDRYFSAGNRNEVWYYRIVGGTHDWPSIGLRWWNNPLAWWYFRNGNQDIDASEEIWTFFKRYL